MLHATSFGAYVRQANKQSNWNRKILHGIVNFAATLNTQTWVWNYKQSKCANDPNCWMRSHGRVAGHKCAGGNGQGNATARCGVADKRKESCSNLTSLTCARVCVCVYFVVVELCGGSLQCGVRIQSAICAWTRVDFIWFEFFPKAHKFRNKCAHIHTHIYMHLRLFRPNLAL